MDQQAGKDLSGHLAGLDGLRGLAAVMVVLFHATAGFVLPALHPPPAILSHGHAAVLLFFALSGLVLAHVYAEPFARSWSWTAAGRYLWARFARLWPLHTVALLAFGCLFWLLVGPPQAEGRYGWPAFLVSLTMMQGLVHGSVWNYPAWSIGIEAACYPFLPLLVPVLWRLPPRAAPVLAMGCACLPWGLAGLGGGLVAGRLLEGGAMFLAGILLRRGLDAPAWRRGLAAPWLAWLVLAGVGGLLASRCDARSLAPALLLLVAVTAAPGGIVGRALAGPRLQWLGERSYGVYLLHAPLQELLLPALLACIGLADRAALGGPWSWGVALASLGLTLAVADSAYRRVERPGRAWLRRFGDGWGRK